MLAQVGGVVKLGVCGRRGCGKVGQNPLQGHLSPFRFLAPVTGQCHNRGVGVQHLHLGGTFRVCRAFYDRDESDVGWERVACCTAEELGFWQ